MNELLTILEYYLIIETLASLFFVQILLLLFATVLIQAITMIRPTSINASIAAIGLFVAILLFPLIALAYVSAQKIKKLPKQWQTRVRVLTRFFFLVCLVSLIVGSWMHTELLVWSLIILYWIDYLNQMIAAVNEENTNDTDDNDGDDPEDGPTPTGDAVDQFLRTLQRIKR